MSLTSERKNSLNRNYLRMMTDIKKPTTLMIVSKNRSAEEIEYFYSLGHRDFGENRVQELYDKSDLLYERCPDIRWHMIGHLQSNKLNQLFKITNLVAIHSVDDGDLLEKICKKDLEIRHKVGVFLQVNTSMEDEKSGFEKIENLLEVLTHFKTTQNIFWQGLMTMGTIRTDEPLVEAKRCFTDLIQWRDQLISYAGKKLELSMGMSADYKIACDLHSDWIRVGTTMFAD